MSADAAAGPPSSTTSTQVVVVGAGLAGLVATCELLDAGRRVVLLDQESAANLGGQAHWSFGGLFLIDSPEQRRLRIRDSGELAWSDWLGTAGFDRPAVVLTTVNAASQMVPPRARLRAASFTATVGQRVDMAALRAFLAGMGFQQSATVTEPGDFAVRGGIIDVYPPGRGGPAYASRSAK